MKRNGGSIRVTSEPGNGSLITILLPSCPDTNACQEAVPAGVLHAGAESVLLVEDYPVFLPIAGKALRHLGYKVVSASTPDHAIRQFHEQPDGIDILITDVVMPDMNGHEMSRILTALKPDLKTLYMSGYTAEMLSARGILSGKEAFLQKPFSLADMARKVRGLLDGPASA